MTDRKYSGNDMTMIICAYKECIFLEDCIKSVLEQSVKSRVFISTSTPNDFIKGLAAKYDIEVKVNNNPGHANDYNFAIKQCETALCAMAHQDDLLDRDFVKDSITAINNAKDPIIAFTDYREIHENSIADKPTTLIRIKKILLLPMKIKGLNGTAFGKRLIQRFGNPISHPTVTYVCDKMPDQCFRNEYRADMDWDLWERLSRVKGSFVYVNKVLHYHRMHAEQATARLVNDENSSKNKMDDPRYREDLILFKRFWPSFIAKAIMSVYSNGEKMYQ